MLAVLAGLLVWIPSLLGWGGAVLSAALGGQLPDDDETGFALRGLAGLGVLGTIGAALNLLVGLGPVLSAAAALSGLALFAQDRRRSLGPLTRSDVFAFLGLTVLLALLASGPIRLYDTGLYHLPAVSWSVAGPLPAGLANLHRRFGLDSLWFPAAALLELPGFSGWSPSLASPLVLFFFGSAVWSAGKRAVKGTADAASLLLALGAVPLAVLAMNGGVPSLSTDLPAAALTILSAHFLLRPAPTRAERRAAVALALFAAIVKLSATVWLLAVVFAVRTFPLAPILAVVAWVTRGITLSGFLLYPVSATRIPLLTWATPIETARAEIDWARSWARLPHRPPEEVLTGWAWLHPWATATMTRPSVLPLVLLFVAGAVALLLSRGRSAIALPARPILVTLFAALASTLFWFWSAPDPRFGYGPLFVLAALPLATALPRLGFGAWPVRIRAALAGALGAGLLVAGGVFLLTGAGFRPNALFPAGAPHTAVGERQTRDGETVFVPSGDDRCWDAPRPCTPFFRPDLVIERDGRGRPRVFWFAPTSETPVGKAAPQ